MGLHRKRSAMPVRHSAFATPLTANPAYIVDEYFRPFVARLSVHIQGLTPSPPPAIGAAICVSAGLAQAQAAATRVSPIGL